MNESEDEGYQKWLADYKKKFGDILPDENTLAQAWEEQKEKDASEEDSGL